MNCIYLTQRTKKYKPYFFCRLNKQQITFLQCKKCSELKYKEIKTIKKKSNKLAKLEKDRFSIITNKIEKCYFCPKKKMELHEVFRGRNRQKSIKWGLVVPICEECHRKITDDKNFSKILEEKAKKIFVKKYGEEKFIEEFK